MIETRAWGISDVVAELDKIESLISAATRLINDGRMIDLGALLRRTQETCDAAIALSPQDSKSLLPSLELVIAKLDALTDQLNSRFGDLPNLQDEAAPRVAASAYGRLQETEL